MLKVITSVVTGRTVKMGRRRPLTRPRLSLANYLTKAVLPPPPATMFYYEHACEALSEMYLNDQLGDCVIAEMEHTEGVWFGNANNSKPLLFTNPQTVAAYSAIGGYVPGDESTDQGCDEQTALRYWKKTGLAQGSKIHGWVAVNGADAVETRTAIWLFENLMFGVELPDAWVSPMPSSDNWTWDVAGEPDPDNGHCFGAFGYEPGALRISTWGMGGWITDAAVAKYATTPFQGELYAVLSLDSIEKATQKAPNGFNAAQLIADLGGIG